MENLQFDVLRQRRQTHTPSNCLNKVIFPCKRKIHAGEVYSYLIYFIKCHHLDEFTLQESLCCQIEVTAVSLK